MTLSLGFFGFFCRRKRAWWWGKVQDTLRADPFGCSVFHFYSRLRFRHQEYLQKRVRHQYQTTLHAYLCNASSFNCGETEKKRPLFDALDCPTLFVSDLKPDHLSGSGLFWDAAVCRRDSLRRHTRHSDGMTDLESSSSPPNRCPAPVAQPPPPHQ